jgi:putative acetyltransferase
MRIRAEAPGDEVAIHRVNALAFETEAEANLVDALRRNGGVTLSLVAEDEGEIVAHILFSPVTIDRGGAVSTMIGLAPMAVVPSHQRRGIGSRLVREGIDRLRGLGHGAIIVLGHPEFYPRFGFSRASEFGLRWENECSDEAFMALELVEGALGAGEGIVRYRPELSEV